MLFKRKIDGSTIYIWTVSAVFLLKQIFRYGNEWEETDLIRFTGKASDILEGAKILFGDRTEDLTICVKKEGKGLKIDRIGDDITICYNKKAEFFRAMVLLLEDYGAVKEVHIRQTPKFETIGFMPQCASGSLTVESVKEVIRYMARMGMNFLMLYTEEAYEVEDLPYHGYMRGRYTQAELKECDEYADLFGIEMIPCIQTLAHLRAALRWNYTNEIKDTDDVLLVGEDKTYEFLEKTIQAAIAPYKSRRIHLGLDEAATLGRGQYLRKHGHESQIEIFAKHLKTLVKMTNKLGLQPMMWSDMYLSLSSPIGDMYDPDLNVPQEIADEAPEELELVYWDYYNEDKDAYRKAIDQHRKFKAKTIFAGGIWLWNGLVPNLEKTVATTRQALEVCKEKKVSEVFATVWGTAPSIYTALPGLQLYAEYGYQDEVTDELLKQRFKACVHEDWEAFEVISQLDYITDRRAQNWYNPSDPASFLLWQNIMLGLFDKHIENMDTFGYYEKLAEDLAAWEEKSGFKRTFRYYKELARTLSLKADIGVRIKNAYDANDRTALTHLAEQVLPDIRVRLEGLRLAHMEMWIECRKPFGMERLDLQYGSLIASADTAVYRIQSFLKGDVDVLEEMEEERLYYGNLAPGQKGLSWNETSFLKVYSV